MSNNEEILIFTDKAVETIRCGWLVNQKIDAEYKSTSNLDKFRSAVESSNIAFIVIDSESNLSPDNLRELIGLAKRKAIPIIFSSLRDNPTHNTRIECDESSPALRKLTLHRMWPESVSVEKENIQLVTETAATLCHEINNPLMAITANIEVLLGGNNNLPDDVRKKVRLIGRAANRIKTATEKLTRLDSLTYKNTIAGRMINLRDSAVNRVSRLSEIAE